MSDGLHQPAIEASRRPSLSLLEFDERFDVFKEFVMYDFACPMKLPCMSSIKLQHCTQRHN